MLEPGIYFNMGDAYYTDHGMGSTSAAQLIESPRLFWWHWPLNPKHKPLAPSSSMKFGNIFHTAILEPELFDKRYARQPQGKKYISTASELKGAFDDVGVEYKRTSSKADLIEEHGAYLETFGYTIKELFTQKTEQQNIQVMTLSEEQLLDDMLQGVSYDKAISQYYLEDALREVSIVIDDELSGARLRCRLDAVSERCIVDLKTIRSIDSMEIYHGFDRRNNHLQSGGYLYVIKQAMKQRDKLKTDCPDLFDRFFDLIEKNGLRFEFWYVDKNPPHCSCPIVVPVDKIEDGFHLWTDAVKTFRQQIAEHGIKEPWDNKYGSDSIDLYNLGGN